MAPDTPDTPDTTPSFDASVRVADRSYAVGEAIAPLVLPEAAGGNGALRYALRPDVPGLTFDPRTRTLSGAPSTADTYKMTYRVTDADDNTSDGDADTLIFDIAVRPRSRSAVSCTYRGSGDQVCAVDTDGRALDEVAVSLRLGTTRPDVHVIATNTNSYPASARVVRLDAEADDARRGRAAGIDRPSRSRPSSSDSSAHAPAWVVEFNNNPPLPLVSRATGRARSELGAPSRPAEVGDTEIFNVFRGRGASAVRATARATVAGGGLTHRLAVWVADASWSDAHSTCSQVNCVTQPMVDAIAATFLKAGPDNDTYDWVTAVFGAPWGDHDNPDLISPDTDEIHVLLFDINGDESTEGGVLGYFYGGNVIRRDPDFPGFATNEKLMFYLDSVLLAEPDGAAWDLTDHWPSVLTGTLAHEFQHMIHLYQKIVRRGAVSEAWLNEMSSEMAVDLTARKREIFGPRGVAHTDGSAGQPVNRRGRLPRYNWHNDIQVTSWQNALENYAINYALGAYLARTYGAELFSRIVQSDRSGTAAIEAAITALTGARTTFGQVLADWAVANLLSDDPGAAAPYRYNSGDWIRSAAGGVTFDLGSINLYHYRFQYGPVADKYLDGPFLHPFQEFSDGVIRRPHSNAYTTLGRVTGTIRLRVNADAGMRITVVVKE